MAGEKSDGDSESRSPGLNVVVPYVLAMIIIVVGVDILFLRHDFLARLLVNIGIVLGFGTVYVRFGRRR